MSLPFKTFLSYQDLIKRINGQEDDPEIKKWRANAEKWRTKKIKG